MSEPQSRELMARRYRPSTTATNCMAHISKGILDRPADCPRCQADVSNALASAFAANEWLNKWRDDALDVLTRQDAALMMLQGWVTVERREGGLADVVRPHVDDQIEEEVLLGPVPFTQARELETWLLRVVELADGVRSLIDMEGRTDGPR